MDHHEETVLEALQPHDIQRLYEDHQKLLVLYGFANAISLMQEPEMILHETMNVLFGLVKAERGAVFFLDEKTQELLPKLTRERDKKEKAKEVTLSRTVLHYVLEERKGILSLDATTDARFQGSQSIQIENIRNVICVPMESPRRIFGILYVDSRLPEGGFSREDLTFVSALANQTAIALENVELLQRLDQERRRIEEILNDLTVGVLSIEENGALSFINPKAEKVLRQIRRDQTGQDVFPLLNTQELTPLHEVIREAQSRHLPVSQQEVAVFFYGAPRVLEVSIIPLDQLKERRLVVLLEDVTEKRELAREVTRTEKLRAIGEMAAGLIHEINNPLNIISGRAQLLFLKYRQDPEIQRAVGIIRGQVDRASQITEKLLNFAKQRLPQLQRLDLCRLLKEVLNTLEVQFAKANVALVCHIPRTPCLIQGDPAQLEEVVSNVTMNAIQAMPKGGTFTISCSEEDHQVAVRFQDTGIGIPQEQLSKIFVPFFTTKPHGTGLGLSVVHGIVEAHRGTIKIQSELGRGTTFCLTFPSAEERG